MEKDLNKSERKIGDDDDDDDSSGSFGSKKSSISKKSKSSKEHSQDSDEVEQKPEKKAKFFERTPERDEKESAEFSDIESATSEYGENDTEESREIDDSGVEHLTDEEVKEAILAIVESRSEDIGKEMSGVEENSAEEIDLVARAAYLESLKDLIGQTDQPTQSTVEEAYEFTSDGLDSLVDEQEQESAESAQTTEEGEVNEQFNREQEHEDLQDDDIVALSTPPLLNPPPPPGSTGGSGNNPPQNPNTHTQPPNPNRQPHPVSPNTANNPNVVYRGRRSDMLVGAILGYIVGRRGGRKRTEKKLMPKIENLEKEINELHAIVYDNEQKISKQARALTVNKDKEKIAKISEKMVDHAKLKEALKDVPKETENIESEKHIKKIEHFSLRNIAVFVDRTEISADNTEKSRKAVEIMTVVELLEKVENVEIDGQLIIDLFKTGRLQERVLREVVKNYMRGGPYEEILRRELAINSVELEVKRQQAESTSSSSDSVTSNSKQKMDSQPLDIINYPQSAKAQKITNKQASRQASGKQAVISGVFIAAIFITVLVIYLLIR